MAAPMISDEVLTQDGIGQIAQISTQVNAPIAFQDELLYNVGNIDRVEISQVEEDIENSSDDEVDRLFQVDGDCGPCVQMELGYVSYESEVEDEDYTPDTLDNEDSDGWGSLVDEGGPDPEVEIRSNDDDTNAFVQTTRNLYQKEDAEKVEEGDVMGKNNDFTLTHGRMWSTMNECRTFFKNKAVGEKFGYKQVKNDTKRVRLRCKDYSCKWLVSCRVLPDKHMIKLRKFIDEHTCEADSGDKNVQAKAPWVVSVLEEILRTHPHFTPKNIQDEIFEKHGVNISYKTAWKAKVRLLEKINGSYEQGYMLVSEICKQVVERNPGSDARWFKDESTEEFQGLFLAYKASLDGWVAGCRPMVGLDGCFLKGKYGGCCLSAMGMDACNGLFPLAIYICRGENKNSWSMILALLQQHLNKHKDNITFISDRQKGLLKAVKEPFPKANHRYCFRHMYKIFKDSGFTGDHLENLSWGAAKAYKISEFDRIMEIMEKDAINAKDWLNKVDKKCWASAHFDQTSKCDAITNNFSESFNSWILKIRHKPLNKFVDKLTLALMSLVYDRRMQSREMIDGELVPAADLVCKKLEKKYNKYKVQGVSDDTFCAINIKTDKKFTVDLAEMT